MVGKLSVGVPVLHILEGAPAYQAGVRVGDIIVGCNGRDVVTIQDYVEALGDNKERLQTVQVYRGSELLTLQFVRNTEWVGREGGPS